ncbi:MAG: XRE family transcriptional regulator [Alphaproteobacteria bacterium]|nr:MAG: XRE family transcriptional regulator [Alphaproteobacteria bacterium]
MARISVKQDDEGRLVQLGAGVRAIRESAGLSQEALADAAGIDRSHMSRIERGRRNVSFLNVCRIADALGCKPSDILIAGLL